MAYFKMRALPLYVVLYSKYSCYSRSGHHLAIFFASCQVCVVFWGCGQISTGTWLRPADIFLPPTANNQCINLLCHLALNIGTTSGKFSAFLLEPKLECCHLPFRLWFFFATLMKKDITEFKTWKALWGITPSFNKWGKPDPGESMGWKTKDFINLEVLGNHVSILRFSTLIWKLR